MGAGPFIFVTHHSDSPSLIRIAAATITTTTTTAATTTTIITKGDFSDTVDGGVLILLVSGSFLNLGVR
jgi:hypothetical protein